MITNIQRRSKNITRVTYLLILLATLVVLVLSYFHKEVSSDSFIGKAAFKLTYQFFLLVVLGGAVALGFKKFGGLRDAELAEQDALRTSCDSLSRGLIEIYNDSKRIRRLLRARAMKINENESAATELIVSSYDSLMQELNDVQLSFETQKRLVEADAVLSAVAPEVSKCLGSIEKYLNEIIQEYEKNLPSISDELVALANLKFLKEYIGPYAEAKDFKKKFKEPFLEALAALKRAQLRTYD